MPAERLIVILEWVWISRKWQFRDSCSLRWLISFTDDQKWLQMKPGTRCTMVSVSGYCMYVLSVAAEADAAAATVSADCSYVSCRMTHLMHLSFVCCLLWWIFFLPCTCIHEHITALYHYLLRISLYIHKHTNKYEGYQKPPLQQHWLSQWLRWKLCRWCVVSPLRNNTLM